MSRRERKWVGGACYHITHRCLGREFFLKFSRHRDMYQGMLYAASRQFRVDVLDYMITSNHVHLLVTAKEGGQVSLMLKCLHGLFAQRYNRTKGRDGAFWSDRFHSTRIQNGEHLGRCLFYIDMNMVRAGAVRQPSEWRHTAYHEFVGNRRRYKIVNMGRLTRALSISSEERFADWYAKTLSGKVACNMRGREAYWSRAKAVGDEEWIAECLGRDAEPLKRMKIYDSGEVKYLGGKKWH